MSFIPLALFACGGGSNKPSTPAAPLVEKTKVSDPIGENATAEVKSASEQLHVTITLHRECEETKVQLVPQKDGTTKEHDLLKAKWFINRELQLMQGNPRTKSDAQEEFSRPDPAACVDMYILPGEET